MPIVALHLVGFSGEQAEKKNEQRKIYHIRNLFYSHFQLSPIHRPYQTRQPYDYTEIVHTENLYDKHLCLLN